MTFARLLRIWAGSGKRARCRHCHEAIVWVIDDHGKHRPFSPSARPIRTDTIELTGARFDVYDPSTAFHACPKRAPKKPAVQQGSLI